MARLFKLIGTHMPHWKWGFRKRDVPNSSNSSGSSSNQICVFLVAYAHDFALSLVSPPISQTWYAYSKINCSISLPWTKKKHKFSKGATSGSAQPLNFLQPPYSIRISFLSIRLWRGRIIMLLETTISRNKICHEHDLFAISGSRIPSILQCR